MSHIAPFGPLGDPDLPGTDEEPPPPLLRRPAVLAGAAVAAVAVAAAGYVLLGGTGETGSALGTPLRQTAPGLSLAPAPSPTPSAPPESGTGRNPFAGGPVEAGGSEGAGGAAGGAGGGGATQGTVPGAAPAVTVTTTVTGPRVLVPVPPVTTTSTVTVTSTPARPVYLGLYGFASDGRAEFRLNEVPLTVAEKSVFGARYRYVSKAAAAQCVTVLVGTKAHYLCEGDVQRVG
jgi:hypothetical protein